MQMHTKTHLYSGTDILMSCIALLFWYIMTVFLIFCKYVIVLQYQEGRLGTLVHSVDDTVAG